MGGSRVAKELFVGFVGACVLRGKFGLDGRFLQLQVNDRIKQVWFYLPSK